MRIIPQQRDQDFLDLSDQLKKDLSLSVIEGGFALKLAVNGQGDT